jgi:hypothetical protein
MCSRQDTVHGEAMSRVAEDKKYFHAKTKAKPVVRREKNFAG